MKLNECQIMLDELNAEMDQLLYAISHDLRSPLRAIDGFSQAVVEDYGDKLDDTGKDYLNRVQNGGKKINAYIDGLLYMSRDTRGDLAPETVNLSNLTGEINALLAKRYEHHTPRTVVAGGISVIMDRRLARTMLAKLLDNAWKFTQDEDQPLIAFGTMEQDGKSTCFIRDNGIGFDMKYAHGRLFAPFQRMHSTDKYAGVGTGLATAKRIISRHGGKIWAESEPDKGTTIFFRAAAG
jgi:light-regulated signal transduction histidine kinase (bacteriophytochrome)